MDHLRFPKDGLKRVNLMQVLMQGSRGINLTGRDTTGREVPSSQPVSCHVRWSI